MGWLGSSFARVTHIASVSWQVSRWLAGLGQSHSCLELADFCLGSRGDWAMMIPQSSLGLLSCMQGFLGPE